MNWKRRALEVGPRYKLFKHTPHLTKLRRQKPVIDAAFNDESLWKETDKSLLIYKSVRNLPFKSPSRWPEIYARIIELFCIFKKHFEPPQRRWKTRRDHARGAGKAEGDAFWRTAVEHIGDYERKRSR
jgi:hypothetical protein